MGESYRTRRKEIAGVAGHAFDPLNRPIRKLSGNWYIVVFDGTEFEGLKSNLVKPLPAKQPVDYHETPWKFKDKPHIHFVDQDPAIADAFDKAAKAYRAGDKIAIFGCSRGAIRAVDLAQRFEAYGMEVDYLGLLDPVATFYARFIPRIGDNVIKGTVVVKKNARESADFVPIVNDGWFDTEFLAYDSSRIENRVLDFRHQDKELITVGLVDLLARAKAAGVPVRTLKLVGDKLFLDP